LANAPTSDKISGISAESGIPHPALMTFEYFIQFEIEIGTHGPNLYGRVCRTRRQQPAILYGSPNTSVIQLRVHQVQMKE
jgi:hypothetical protein